jgi:large subunit ribosomal protein L17
MRHRKAVLKLNRTPSHRKAMFRNMVTSLFKYERIQTTGAKAKELRRWADHLITLAKRGDLHARRQALAIVREKDVVHKLFEQAAERYGSVSGGYTRIVKLGNRPGDAAPVSLVELIYSQDTKKKKTKKKKAKADAAAKKATAASKPAVDEEKKKAVKADEKKVAEAKTAKGSEKKTKDDKAKSAAKTPSKKKTAGDEKETKPAKEAATKKKAPATKEKPAPTEKEAKATAPKEDADDTKQKKAPAKKAAKDEK